MSGSSVGGLLFPLLVRYLADEYALQGCLLILGAIQLHSLIAALLIRPTSFYESRRRSSPQSELLTTPVSKPISPASESNGSLGSNPLLHKPCDSQSLTQTKRKFRCFRFCNNCYFFVIVFGLGTMYFSFFVQFISFPNLALEIGFSKQMAAVFMSTVGGVDLVGRLGLGLVLDFHFIGKLTLLQIACVIMAVSGHLLLLYPVLAAMVTYSVLFGVFGGIHMVLMVPLVAEIVHVDETSTAIGLLWMVFGFSAAVSNTLLGEYPGHLMKNIGYFL